MKRLVGFQSVSTEIFQIRSTGSLLLKPTSASSQTHILLSTPIYPLRSMSMTDLLHSSLDELLRSCQSRVQHAEQLATLAHGPTQQHRQVNLLPALHCAHSPVTPLLVVSLCQFL